MGDNGVALRRNFLPSFELALFRQLPFVRLNLYGRKNLGALKSERKEAKMTHEE